MGVFFVGQAGLATATTAAAGLPLDELCRILVVTEQIACRPRLAGLYL